ncbi:MAG: hypothetical protein DME68_08600 [Verrucomicrobia bacterium]|nr:MAG: hypothetical protein DME68_08600 [Verrucomicrobiota bacterium]
MRQIKKIVRLALKMAIVARKKHPGIVQRVRMFCSLSIFVIASATGLVRPVMAQAEPLTEQGYERGELGANPYTVPSIARISSSSMILDHCLLSNCSESFPKRVQSSWIFDRNGRRTAN